MSYIRPGKQGGRIHAADLQAQQEIAQAVSYAVHFRKGPVEKYNETAATLDDAKAIAARLNAAHGQFGRRSIIYAVTASGKHVPIPGL